MEKFEINQQESKTVIPSLCHVKQAPVHHYFCSPTMDVGLSSSIRFVGKKQHSFNFENFARNFLKKSCYDDLLNELKGQHTAEDYNTQSHDEWK